MNQAPSSSDRAGSAHSPGTASGTHASVRSEPVAADLARTLGIQATGARRGRHSRRWALAAVVAGALGLFWYAAPFSQAGDGRAYRTEAVSRSDITVIVTATGTVEPTNRVDISSELSGILRSVAVDYNAQVTVGQTLAELDTDRLTAALNSSDARVNAALAQVAEAEATVAEKRSELRRKESLATRQMISTLELESVRAMVARAMASQSRAQADLQAARADFKLNETNLRKSVIRSPIAGVVLSRQAEPGQVIAASLQAPVLFTIAEDLRKMEVAVDVDEADVGKVRPGQQATFTVDAYPEQRFDARITELRYGSQVVQGVVTYKAILVTDNDRLLLRPGMTATAEIVVDSQAQVLSVSNEALRFSPPDLADAPDDRGFLRKLLPTMPRFRPASRPDSVGPDRQLWVLKDGVPAPLAVMVGVTDGRRTQLVSGDLQEGQAVVIDAISPTR